MKKTTLLLILSLLLSAPAMAVDNYHFTNENTEEFYQSGQSSVTYDGEIPSVVANIYDFTPQPVNDGSLGAVVIAPPLDEGYGLGSSTPVNAPGSISRNTNGSAGVTSAGNYGISDSEASYPNTSTQGQTYQPAQTAMTPTSDVRQANGAIGTLKIARVGLSVTVYDGDLTAAMKKGLGHIDSTSAFFGTVGVTGHNRGSNGYFAKLKDVREGDVVTYTTSMGTKTYIVTTVAQIASTDWSLLQPTTDNRLTMITCIANRPSLRLAVQAVEKIS